MRVFVAIDIDRETKNALVHLQQKLQSEADTKKNQCRWVKANAMHLTLKFLGEIKDEKVTEICKTVKDVAGRHNSFDIDVKSVGCFGSKTPTVLWIGTDSEDNALVKLQKELDKELSLKGWPKETRAFTGHLTLCRIKDPKAGLKLANLCQNYKDFKLATMAADSVRVYQSRLTPDGPIYTLLGDYKLK